MSHFLTAPVYFPDRVIGSLKPRHSEDNSIKTMKQLHLIACVGLIANLALASHSHAAHIIDSPWSQGFPKKIANLAYGALPDGYHGWGVRKRGGLDIEFKKTGNLIHGELYEAGNSYCFTGEYFPASGKIAIRKISSHYLGARLVALGVDEVVNLGFHASNNAFSMKCINRGHQGE